MMFKKAFFGIIILLIFFTPSTLVNAEENSGIPDGEILIIYSDGADEDALQAVQSIVEILTYQSFKVSFASASDSTEELDRFSNIICYQLEKYPKELLEKFQTLEETTSDTTKGRPKDFKHNILFMGNDCLKAYLDGSGRNDYLSDEMKIGKVTYNFSELTSKEELVEENFFLFLKDNLDYTSGKIETEDTEGYFCASKGNITHIPVSDLSDELVKAAFVKEVAAWKWPYNGEPNIYAQYIVLNQVYPFEDPDKLLKVINYLVEKKEPFVISVMPIYTNGTFPAMQQFCEILRYAQDNGGTIIMHCPINQMISFDKDLMNKYIRISLQIYMDQGVYPMGLQVPENWMLNDDTIDIMSHFSTIFTTNEEDQQIEAQMDSNTNLIYKDGHHWVSSSIRLDDTGVSYTKVSSTAVYLDMTEDIPILEYKIDVCQKSFVPLKSLWDIEHSFWTDEDLMKYSNQIIMINGERAERGFTPTEYDTNYKYDRNILNQFSKDLSSENQKLIIAVFIISIIFILFIFLSRHRNREKFFIKNENDEVEEDKKDGN